MDNGETKQEVVGSVKSNRAVTDSFILVHSVLDVYGHPVVLEEVEIVGSSDLLRSPIKQFKKAAIARVRSVDAGSWRNISLKICFDARAHIS